MVRQLTWIAVAEVGDYLEFLDTGDGDTSMYEVIEEPKVFNVQRSIRVKFIRETGLGDSKFNLQSEHIQFVSLSQSKALTLLKLMPAT